jgi:hypothetical protein
MENTIMALKLFFLYCLSKKIKFKKWKMDEGIISEYL